MAALETTNVTSIQPDVRRNWSTARFLHRSNAAGMDFTDGERDIIVPNRDPEAIAAAVLKICEDRGLRDRMSYNTRREAQVYATNVWEERFIGAIREASR